MATRAMIGKVTPGGAVTAIYSHWDGYPAHVGLLLKTFYDTDHKLTALLDRGDVSSLGGSLEETTFYNQLLMLGKEEHDYADSTAKQFPDITAAVQYYHECWCEYFYTFEDGIWWVRAGEGPARSLVGVIEDLREEQHNDSE